MADLNNMGGTPGSGVSDIAQALNNANVNMSLLIQTIQNIFPRTTGTFTLSASSATLVTQTGVGAASIISTPIPTNASAALLMGSAKSLYISTSVVGASFTVSTANGSAAAGNETFRYMIFNPV